MNINNTEIKLKQTFRALILFEEITGESFTGKGMKEILVYFYSVILANNPEFNMPFDEFIDYLDEHNDLLTEFLEWLNKLNERNKITPTEESDGVKKN